MSEAILTTDNGSVTENDQWSSQAPREQLVKPLPDAGATGKTTDEPVATTIDASESVPSRPKATAAGNAKVNRAKAATGAAVKGDTRHKKAGPKSRRGEPKIKYVPQSELDGQLAELEKLSRAARAGDDKALDELRHALNDAYPHVWRRVADLQIPVEQKLVNLVAGQDPLRIEAFRKRCSELRYDLLERQPSSSATKMAASRVVTCWMFTQALELRVLESSNNRWPMKELELAERRYQSAMRTYGQARQLDLQLQRLRMQVNGSGQNAQRS